MSRLFRVLSGRCAGQVLPESEVCECERCEGRGEIRGSFGGDGYGDRCCGWTDYEADCPVCGGVGYVLGYPETGLPHRLQVVEDIEPGVYATAPTPETSRAPATPASPSNAVHQKSA